MISFRFVVHRSTLSIAFTAFFTMVILFSCGEPRQAPDITGIEVMTASDRVRSGIAMGGIGTGYVELRKDGQFYNWTIFNNQPLSTGAPLDLRTYPHKEVEEALQFFIVRYREEGKEMKMKLLQLNDSQFEGGLESITYYYPWMTGVERIEYRGRFPFVNMKFSDPEMPFDIYLEAFSPFIPHDPKHSSLPGVFFDFRVQATGSNDVNVMLIASQRNLVGYDVQDKYFISELEQGNNFVFFNQTVGGMDTTHSSFGQMGMASLSDESTWYLGWEHKHPYYENLLFENTFRNINDTEGRNFTDRWTGEKIGRYGNRELEQRCFSSIAITKDLAPGESFDHSFIMTWYFPNNYGAHNDNSPQTERQKEDFTFGQQLTKDQGHYYENFFSSAGEVAKYMKANKADLTDRTRKFVDDFYASTLDRFVLDQVNSNLNTFITSSTFIENGNFGIREGMSPHKSWGPNTTIDVSLYGSSAIINLFPELWKNAMRTHKALQTPQGEINHGLGFDLDYTQNGTWGVFHRIDMPGNYIQLVMRDFFHTNDRAYLDEMWPSLKLAVEYVLNERDEDGDMMPDMTGIMCSYDNFPMYGLSSYIQSQWIAAMKSMMEGAEVMGDEEAYEKYSAIYERGSELMDEHLWNGEYYILSRDYTGLCSDIEDATEEDQACLTDQIIGQWIAHQSHLGYLFNEAHVKQALQNVIKMSFRKGFGLRNCSWPEYPELYPIHETNLWVDQANTPWTGVELAFASFLIYEGFVEEAMAVIREVDDRQRKAGLYWDHQEFGGHYYRPMSAWQIMNALLGLGINQDVYYFSPALENPEFTVFFAFDAGTAHFIRSDGSATIRVLSGEFNPEKLVFSGSGIESDSPTVLVNGNPADVAVELENGFIVVLTGPEFVLGEGDEIQIH